jgi:hypothetical protein
VRSDLKIKCWARFRTARLSFPPFLVPAKRIPDPLCRCPGDLRKVRHRAAVILADLRFDSRFELGTHGHDWWGVGDVIAVEAVDLVRVIGERIKPHVVSLEELFDGGRVVAVARREVPRRTVAAIEHRAHALALLEGRTEALHRGLFLDPCQRRRLWRRPCCRWPQGRCT